MSEEARTTVVIARKCSDAFFSNPFCEESHIYDDVADTEPSAYDDVADTEHFALPPSAPYNRLGKRTDTPMPRRASPPTPPPKPLYLRQSNSTGVSTGSSWDSTTFSSRHSADDEPPMPHAQAQAVVLRDYRRKDLTEIDLDVGDVITHIEQVHGRNLCNSA